MIIGIDLDDTISALPALFSLLTSALIDAGHEVHVITYRIPGTENRARRELAELGIRYTQLHLPTGPGPAPEWKAQVVTELGVELMIEDSPEVLARMPEGVQRLWICDREIFDLDVCIRALNGG